MKLTRRGASAVGCTLALLAGALLLAEPILLLGAAGVVAWLLGSQAAFAAALRRERDELTAELDVPAGHPAVGDSSSLQLAASGRGSLPLHVGVDLPAAARSSDRDDSDDAATGIGAAPHGSSNGTSSATDAPALAVTLGTERDEPDDEQRRRSTSAVAAAVEWPIAGRFRVGPVRATATDRQGLFTASFETDAAEDVIVRSREPETSHLGLGDDRVVAFGEHTTDRRGPGTEPVELRPYTLGDEVGRIDWNATARLQQAYVTESDAETDRRTVLFLDHRATTGIGTPGATGFDHLRYAALAIVESARELGDPLGCYAVGDEGVTVERPPRTTPGQYDAVAESLRGLTPTMDPGAVADEVGPRPGSAGPSTGGQPGATAAVPTGTRSVPSASADPAAAATKADRLAGDDSAFGEHLRPLLSDASPYLHRVADRPLFEAVRTYQGRLQGTVWSIVLTDGERPAELRETVKFARRGRGRVLVLLAPAPLFDDERMDPEDRRRASEDVAAFARSLAAMDGVTVREIAPDAPVEDVIGNRGDQR